MIACYGGDVNPRFGLEVTVLITVTLLLAAACLAPAAGKLLAHPQMQASAARFGIPWSRYRLIGVAELAAVAGILAGLVVPAVGVAAALGMIVLLVGALVVHRQAGDNPKDAIPAFVALGLSAAYLVLLLSH